MLFPLHRSKIQTRNVNEVVTLNVNETETKKYVKQAIHVNRKHLRRRWGSTGTSLDILSHFFQANFLFSHFQPLAYILYSTTFLTEHQNTVKEIIKKSKLPYYIFA